MKLYFSPASPFARKVLITAIELGIDDKIERIDAPTTPIDPKADLAAVNPLAKLPTLMTDDGEALYDSSVVCEYLASEFGGEALLPAAGRARWAALRLQSLADGMLDAAVLRRYEVAMRPEELRMESWDQGQKGKIVRALDVLDKNIGMLGDTPTLGTIAVACVLGYLDFRFADEDWRTGRDNLAGWFQDCWASRSSFVATPPPS